MDEKALYFCVALRDVATAPRYSLANAR